MVEVSIFGKMSDATITPVDCRLCVVKVKTHNYVVCLRDDLAPTIVLDDGPSTPATPPAVSEADLAREKTHAARATRDLRTFVLVRNPRHTFTEKDKLVNALRRTVKEPKPAKISRKDEREASRRFHEFRAFMTHVYTNQFAFMFRQREDVRIADASVAVAPHPEPMDLCSSDDEAPALKQQRTR